MAEPFSYDVVAYPSQTVPAMHPDRLFVLARLFGLPAAPPDRGRFLEVGCGSGAHLLAAAQQLPDAEFVGIDLAEAAVHEGRETAAALGLNNVRLEHADLTTWQPDRPFDFVATHGVYSWVPAPVRDALLGLVRRALAPAGVGYVSFNALPGCHLRRVIWDALRLHAGGAADPAEKLERAEQMLQLLSDGLEGRTDPPQAWLRADVGRVLLREQRFLTYHDDLAEVNHPVYFLDFVGHAGRHGLRFLADAELAAMSDEAYPPAVAGALGQIGRQNPLLREQYRDFLKVRRFRGTLVCHADRPTLADPTPAAVGDLWASTRLRLAGEPSEDGEAEFLLEDGGTVPVADPFTRRLLLALADRTPEAVPVARLAGDDEERAAVLTAARAGVIALHGRPAACVREAGERPTISPLARRQAALGQTVSTSLFTPLHMTDPASQALLPLLDGTRTRDELITALHAAVPGLGSAEEVADGLAITLDKLARAGMLVA